MKLTNRYLFFLFLKIGATSWGGFMALIAVIQKQMSESDNAIEQEEIVYAISLASVLPGPMAVNVVAYIGYKLNGLKGALISIIGVLLPCFILMILLSYVYFTYSNIPSFSHFFLGILPAVAAILVNVSFAMGKKNIKDSKQVVIALISVATILFLHSVYTTIFIVLASGFAGYFIYKNKEITEPSAMPISFFTGNKKMFKKYIIYTISLLLIAGLLYYLSIQKTALFHIYSQIVFTFSGLSISQFGGGYVVIPSMQKIIVDSLHWLTQQQFTDAIAMGQITPGPIYISAAFIGYKLSGIMGALIATIAMFLPAAALMIFCAKFLSAISKAPAITAAFKGIGAAITGMIAATAMVMLYNTKAAYIPLLMLFVIYLFILYQYKITPVILIPLAGIAGLLIF